MRRSNSPQQNPAQNRLLAQFPTAVYRRIAPELEPVVPQVGQVVYEAGDRVKYLYFPSRNTMFSLLCTSQDANAIKVAVTGWEGFVGFAPLMGGSTSSLRFAAPATKGGWELNESSIPAWLYSFLCQITGHGRIPSGSV
jgi:hypothetical protein